MSCPRSGHPRGQSRAKCGDDLLQPSRHANLIHSDRRQQLNAAGLFHFRRSLGWEHATAPQRRHPADEAGKARRECTHPYMQKTLFAMNNSRLQREQIDVAAPVQRDRGHFVLLMISPFWVLTVSIWTAEPDTVTAWFSVPISRVASARSAEFTFTVNWRIWNSLNPG